MEHKLATVLEEFGVPERKLRADVASLGLVLDRRSYTMDDKVYKALKEKYASPQKVDSKVQIIPTRGAKKAAKKPEPKKEAKAVEKKVPAKAVVKEKKVTQPVKKVAAKAKKESVPAKQQKELEKKIVEEALIVAPKLVEKAIPQKVAPTVQKTIVPPAPVKTKVPEPAAVVAPVVEAKPAEQEAKESDLPVVYVPHSITVKDFAVLLKVGVNQIISELFKNGIMANINQRLDFDIVEILAQEFGAKAVEQSSTEVTNDNVQLNSLLEDDEKNLSPRAPVISVMGHVDHGKTKLLDAIRGTTVMEGEAGGITQKIGAYQILKKTRDGTLKTITFLDTPGHQAFTAMRARGAQVTDIAILVVAADDGVKPQTIEAYEHAKAAGVPVVVAITKIDKDGANPDRVKAELAEIGLAVEEWGGSTVCAEVSAVKKTGIDDLLELVLLVADMQDLKANANRSAVGTIIESRLDQSHGALATVLVHTGTLHMRDDVVIGDVFGKIRSLNNDRGEHIESAGPSQPVQITGLSKVPHVGDILRVVANKKDARSLVQKSFREKQSDLLSGISQAPAKEGVKELKVVIKADTKGSLEALRGALLSLPAEKIVVKIIYAGLGNISNSDVMIASAGKGSVFGFNVLTPVAIQKSADIEKVKITTFDVIYHLLDEVQKVLLTMLEPEVRVTILGKLRVLKIFYDGKGEQVVGGDVIQGKVARNSFAKIYRGDHIVGEMDLKTVQEGPEEMKEIQQGAQCGMKLTGNIRIMPDDIIECYIKEKLAVSLS